MAVRFRGGAAWEKQSLELAGTLLLQLAASRWPPARVNRQLLVVKLVRCGGTTVGFAPPGAGSLCSQLQGGDVQTPVLGPPFLTLAPFIQQTVSLAQALGTKWKTTGQSSRRSPVCPILPLSPRPPPLGNAGHTFPECHHFSLSIKKSFTTTVTPTNNSPLPCSVQEK